MPTRKTKNTERSMRQGMKRERILSLILIILSVLCIGCGSTQSQAAAVPEQEQPAEAPPTEGEETMTDLPDPHEQPQDSGAENKKAETMRLKIGETEVSVAWEDNESVDALKELARDGLSIPIPCTAGLSRSAPSERICPEKTARRQRRPGISCCTPETSLSSSTDRTAGPIPGSGRSWTSLHRN